MNIYQHKETKDIVTLISKYTATNKYEYYAVSNDDNTQGRDFHSLAQGKAFLAQNKDWTLFRVIPNEIDEYFDESERGWFQAQGHCL